MLRLSDFKNCLNRTEKQNETKLVDNLRKHFILYILFWVSGLPSNQCVADKHYSKPVAGD